MKLRLLLIAILLEMLAAGCGTTHHFLPPRPLEKREWMLSVTWHYDLGRLTPPAILPDVNAYVGVGKEYNFGFGAQAPSFISHISLAKYYETSDDNFWSSFIHLNQIFGANNNPYVEAGGAYADHRGTYDRMYMFGLAYGHGANLPMLMLSNLNARGRAVMRHCRIMPFLKFSGSGSDFGFSLSHYLGLSKTAMSIYKDSSITGIDTMYTIPADQIDSVVLRSNPDTGSLYKYGYKCDEVVAIYLKSADSIVFCGHPTPLCAHASKPYRELQYWLKDDYKVYMGDDYAYLIMNGDSLAAAWKRGEELVIVNWAPAMINKIDRINGLIDDNSFGLGIINYRRPRE